jgi:hypothetical protein
METKYTPCWCDQASNGSQIVLKINYVHTRGGVIAPPFGVIETSVWCDHFKCFSLMQTHKHHAQHHAASDGVSTAV